MCNTPVFPYVVESNDVKSSKKWRCRQGDMMNLDVRAIWDSALFKGLSNRELELICGSVSPVLKTYEKNETVIGQGDVVKSIGIIKEGVITGTKYHYDGTAQIIKILKETEIVGLEAVSSTFCTSPCMLSADTDCQVVFFAYKRLLDRDLLGVSIRDRIYDNLINILSDESIKMMYKIDTLSKRTLRERILTYLSIIGEKRGKKTFDIGMTQERFAQYLCANRSALSRELNAMRREHIIDFKRTTYTILDFDEKKDPAER